MGKLYPPPPRNKPKIYFMRTYIYYNKRDSSQEPQGKIEAENITEAIEKAAVVKQMDLDTFLKVFGMKTKTHGKIKV
jgi:hypothetical protein